MENGYSVNRVAELTGMKARTIRQWIHDGTLKASKLEGSRRWVILESEVRRIRQEGNSENIGD